MTPTWIAIIAASTIFVLGAISFSFYWFIWRTALVKEVQVSKHGTSTTGAYRVGDNISVFVTRENEKGIKTEFVYEFFNGIEWIPMAGGNKTTMEHMMYTLPIGTFSRECKVRVRDPFSRYIKESKNFTVLPLFAVSRGPADDSAHVAMLRQFDTFKFRMDLDNNMNWGNQLVFLLRDLHTGVLISNDIGTLTPNADGSYTASWIPSSNYTQPCKLTITTSNLINQCYPKELNTTLPGKIQMIDKISGPANQGAGAFRPHSHVINMPPKLHNFLLPPDTVDNVLNLNNQQSPVTIRGFRFIYAGKFDDLGIISFTTTPTLPPGSFTPSQGQIMESGVTFYEFVITSEAITTPGTVVTLLDPTKAFTLTVTSEALNTSYSIDNIQIVNQYVPGNEFRLYASISEPPLRVVSNDGDSANFYPGETLDATVYYIGDGSADNLALISILTVPPITGLVTTINTTDEKTNAETQQAALNVTLPNTVIGGQKTYTPSTSPLPLYDGTVTFQATINNNTFNSTLYPSYVGPYVSIKINGGNTVDFTFNMTGAAPNRLPYTLKVLGGESLRGYKLYISRNTNILNGYTRSSNDGLWNFGPLPLTSVSFPTTASTTSYLDITSDDLDQIGIPLIDSDGYSSIYVIAEYYVKAPNSATPPVDQIYRMLAVSEAIAVKRTVYRTVSSNMYANLTGTNCVVAQAVPDASLGGRFGTNKVEGQLFTANYSTQVQFVCVGNNWFILPRLFRLQFPTPFQSNAKGIRVGPLGGVDDSHSNIVAQIEEEEITLDQPVGYFRLRMLLDNIAVGNSTKKFTGYLQHEASGKYLRVRKATYSDQGLDVSQGDPNFYSKGTICCQDGMIANDPTLRNTHNIIPNKLSDFEAFKTADMALFTMDGTAITDGTVFTFEQSTNIVNTSNNLIHYTISTTIGPAVYYLACASGLTTNMTPSGEVQRPGGPYSNTNGAEPYYNTHYNFLSTVLQAYQARWVSSTNIQYNALQYVTVSSETIQMNATPFEAPIFITSY